MSDNKPRIKPCPFPNRPMAGDVLSEIRRRKGLTLREFCLGRDLDALRFSMIERDMLYPTREESEHYLALVGPDPREPPPQEESVISKEQMLDYMTRVLNIYNSPQDIPVNYSIRNLIEQYGPGDGEHLEACRDAKRREGDSLAHGPTPGPSPEDREAVERLDGDLNELYGNMMAHHERLASREHSLSFEALAHIRRRLGMEEGKS